MENIDLAVFYADRLLKVNDMVQLSLIGGEIKARLHELRGFEDWLRCYWKSAYKTISTQNRPFEDTLNKKGNEWLRRENDKIQSNQT